MFSVIISVLFISTITYGATTIGSNINTGGTLDVSGDTTVYGATSIGGAITATSTLNVTGLTTLGNASTTQLSITGNLWINGFATTTSSGNIQGQGILTMLGTGTSTFSGGIQSTALNITSATASSTFANGIILSKGCFLMPDGTCAGAGSGGGTINSGTTGQFPYYAGSGTTLTATSSLFLSSNQNLGIGTTTPNWLLQAAGTRPFFTLSDTGAGTDQKHWFLSSQGGNFYVGTSSDAYATSTVSKLTILSNGNVGIGTTTPQSQFALQGNAYFAGNVGIGTANPSAKLDVKGGNVRVTSGEVQAFFSDETTEVHLEVTSAGNASIDTGYQDNLTINTNNTERMFFSGTSDNIGISDDSSDAIFEISGSGGSTDLLMVSSNDNNDGDRLIVKNSGFVGIGTTTPTTMFQVATSTANATTTIEVGKANQNKGSCLKLYDDVGAVYYCRITGGTFTCNTTSCE